MKLPPSLDYLARVVLLAAAYVVVGHAGLQLDPVSNFATLVWAPSGLALAVLLLRADLWPGVALGALGVNLWTGASVPVAAGIAAGSTAAAVLGAGALRRIPGFRPQLDRLRDVLALIGLAAVASTAVSATVGVGSLWLDGKVTAGFGETWRAWWLGDAIGDLVVCPLLLTWRAPLQRLGTPRTRRVAEAAGLALALGALSWYVLGGPAIGTGPLAPFRQRSTLFPLLVWAAVRFGPAGAAGATLLVAGAAVWQAALGHGPFVEAAAPLHETLVLLQVFIATVAGTFLVLAAVTTERQRAEAEREVHLHGERLARADADEALQLRDETLAVVSHDLRSPLAAITATAQSLGRHVTDPGSRHQLELIHRATLRMDRLIGDLLDSSALAAGRLALAAAPHEANDLLREVVELWHSRAAAHGQTLLAEYGDAACPVVCDRERIIQVLSNLLSNALRVTPKGGSILASVKLDGGRVQFAVWDSGPGIPDEHRTRIFQRFWRGPANRGEGSGLGLYIARGIVEAHGGRIWLGEPPGTGTTFRFSLPLAGPPR